MADDITALITAANLGDNAARAALFTHVYGELKLLARRRLAESSNATLNTTELVHEAFLKIGRGDANTIDGRHHFFALAAKAMRHIVIDHARARLAGKRGGADAERIQIDGAGELGDNAIDPERLLRLDRALGGLEAQEPRLARLVELRFFAGLPFAQIAALENVSERTLNRDWRRARAELFSALHTDV